MGAFPVWESEPTQDEKGTGLRGSPVRELDVQWELKATQTFRMLLGMLAPERGEQGTTRRKAACHKLLQPKEGEEHTDTGRQPAEGWKDTSRTGQGAHAARWTTQHGVSQNPGRGHGLYTRGLPKR